MKNKLTDLSDHLFAQIERLSDESLSGETLLQEIKRAGAVERIAGQICNVGQLTLGAAKLRAEYAHQGSSPLPSLLGFDDRP